MPSLRRQIGRIVVTLGATALVAAVLAWAHAGGSDERPLVAAVPGTYYTPRAPASLPSNPRHLPVATFTVARGPGRPVPSSFLGLSSEYWALADYESTGADFTRALSALQAPDNGPLVLRIGGSSADGSYWNPTGQALPAWAYSVAPAWLRATSRLAAAANLSVILDVDLADDSPWLTGLLAHAAREALGQRLLAFELGNEPDLYHGHRLYRALRLARTGRYRIMHLLTRAHYDVADYLQEVSSYARTLAIDAPGVPLAGPAIANVYRDRGWITDLLAAQRPRLALVTGHRYPLSACQRPGWRYYPTIARLLSPASTRRLIRQVGYAVAVSHHAGLPFRLTELNAVTCGGMQGVSDTFAAALWAPEVMFSLMHAGVDGVNFHTRPLSFNGPFFLTPGGLGIRPMFYGLALFQSALGPGARLVGVGVREAPRLQLTAWAVRLSDGTLHVVVLNEGPRAAHVRLPLLAEEPATVQWLQAPSVRARTGVSFAGRSLGEDGRWRGSIASQSLPAQASGYELDVPGYRAALLSVPAS